MADTKVLSRNPIELLKNDHRNVESLFRQYRDLDPADSAGKSEVFEEIRDGLSLHSEIEERFFYPAVSELVDGRAAEIVSEALDRHAEIDGLLDELSTLSPEDDAFDSSMEQLRKAVEEHVEEEETEIFPRAKKLGRNRLQELALEMEGWRGDERE